MAHYLYFDRADMQHPPPIIESRLNTIAAGGTPLNRTIAEIGNSTIGTTQEAIDSCKPLNHIYF
jgi:hypothetical protein